MRQYLVFTLTAPFSSFGTIAVGEIRPTWDRPSKSQVVGFLAAALGIERHEEERQRALANAIGVAVRVDDPGRLIQDYHTSQVPEGPSVRRRLKAGLPVDTRRDELACDDIKTGLSRREYRRDATYTIAVWLLENGTENGTVRLEDLAQALRTPEFTLFAGRKANTLMFPCGPVVTPPVADVISAIVAFDTADRVQRAFRDTFTPASLQKERAGLSRFIHADETAELPLGISPSRYEERRDVPLSRRGWRFVRRTEIVVAFEDEVET